MAEVATRKSRRLPVLLAAVGLLSSLVLEIVHLKTYLVPSASSFCSLGAAFDCTLVAASPSSVFLLPWAIWGILGFYSLFVAALRRSIWLLPLSGIAALASIALLVVELTAVRSICFLCEIVHVVSVALFVVAWRQRTQLIRDEKNATGLNLIFVLPASVALSLWLFVPAYWGSFSYKAAPPFATGVTEDGLPWIGAREPTLTVHEFIDYNCPHCAVASAQSLRLLPKNPGLRIVRRQQPRMRCHEGTSGCRSVRAAMCAGEQGKFWQADRWLFARVEPGHDAHLGSMASELGLDEKKLSSCLDAPATYARATNEASFAFKKKIIETPGYMADGKRLRREVAEKFLKTGKVQLE